MQETDILTQDFNNELEKLKEELLTVATEEDLKTFSILYTEYHSVPEYWSLKHGETFVFMTQTGYSRYKCNKILKAILDVLDKYHYEVVLHYLGFE